MSWMREWMTDWLQAGSGKRRTQTELSALAETDPANISRWINGQARPDRETVGRLASNLEPEEARRLVIAWLRDQTPATAEPLVRVEPEPVGVSLPEEHEDCFPEGMSTELRQRLLFFGRLAIENPAIRRIIDVCYEAAQHPVSRP